MKRAKATANHRRDKKLATESAVPPKGTSKRTLVVIFLVLAAATLLVYAQTFRYDFVLYDDYQYVAEHSMVQQGISARGLVWAFTTFDCSNWHPLTWLSYLTEVTLFGVNPGEEHAVNVLLHLCSTIVLFLALFQMTGRPWRCAFVAGVFALHPLHVESVAWIAERKDVLSTLFVMLTLLLYGRYAKAPSTARYLLVALVFAMSLMAKPMAVTVPFVLLLLDVWPLGRITWPADRRTLGRLVWEKAPLIAMTVAASFLTLAAQRNAVAPLDRVHVAARLANAAVTYVKYLGKAFWPVDLGVLYPFQTPSAEAGFGAMLVLAVITVFSVMLFRRHPYLLVGWLWYLGMLVPVIGIIQVGNQAMADRYTYVPLVGISIALIWFVAAAVERRPELQKVATGISIAVLLVLGVAAFQTAAYWKNSHTLFEHTLAVTSGNAIITTNLGLVVEKEGQYDQAAALFHQAMLIDPNYLYARKNYSNAKNEIGNALETTGRRQEATALYREAIESDPDSAIPRANLGSALLKLGQVEEASRNLAEAIRLDPGLASAQADFGLVLANQGKLDESQQHLEAALRLSAPDAAIQNNLCWVLLHRNRAQEAAGHCQEALRLLPAFTDARFNLASAYLAQGNKAEAARELTLLLKEKPDYAPARAALSELQRAGIH